MRHCTLMSRFDKFVRELKSAALRTPAEREHFKVGHGAGPGTEVRALQGLIHFVAQPDKRVLENVLRLIPVGMKRKDISLDVPGMLKEQASDAINTLQIAGGLHRHRQKSRHDDQR